MDFVRIRGFFTIKVFCLSIYTLKKRYQGCQCMLCPLVDDTFFSFSLLIGFTLVKNQVLCSESIVSTYNKATNQCVESY